VCVSVSASRSRSWTFQGTSHINYLVIKTYKLAQQTGSYTPNPTWEEYGSNMLQLKDTYLILFAINNEKGPQCVQRMSLQVESG